MTLRDEEITRSVNEAGEAIIQFEMDSNCFPVEQPDTYSTYTNDYWLESELEYKAEQGEPSDYDAYNWDYNVSAVIEELGKAGAADIEQQLKDGGVILAVEVTGTYSPREYNFKTDSYKAKYTVNATALDRWCESNGFDPDKYAAEFHGSYSGFASYVDGWLEDSSRRDATIQWLKVDAYLRAELDLDANRDAMQETVDQAWSDNTTYTLQDEAAPTHYCSYCRYYGEGDTLGTLEEITAHGMTHPVTGEPLPIEEG